MRILYLDLDSMRPDHFGCYGYHRDTTPHMDRIAGEGVRFTRAYCASSPCVPSRASFLSGRFGVHHGALTHWGPGSEFRFPGEGHHYWAEMPVLPRFLRRHGYRTASFSTFADRHQAFWFCAGWTEMHSHSLKSGDEGADEVNAAVLPWLDAHGREDDWFLHVQYWDPHRNYYVGQEWVDRFADDPPPAWPDEAAIARHQANHSPFSPGGLYPFERDGKSPSPIMPDRIASREDFRRFVDGYDASIRFMDEHIGRVFQALEDRGVLDETAVIISADHGEAMGEEGIYGDHVSAGEATHNIPLIVRWPGVTEGEGSGRSHDGLLYNVDLHPTLCDLLGLPTPTRWDGGSFAPALRGEGWAGRTHLVWDHALYCCQRAVRTPDRLFVRTYHPGLYPHDPVALYDMARDPRQTTNIAADDPATAAGMDRLLNDWLHENLGYHGARPDPMAEVIRTGPWKYVRPETWIPRLREHGRLAEADALVRRLGLDENLRTRDGHVPV